MKKVRITNVDEMTRTEFKVKVGEVYDVQNEGRGEEGKYGYLIYTKKNRAIVMYSSQVEVLESN